MLLFKKISLLSVFSLVIFPTNFFAGNSKDDVGRVLVIIKNKSERTVVCKITRNKKDKFGIITGVSLKLEKDGSDSMIKLPLRSLFRKNWRKNKEQVPSALLQEFSMEFFDESDKDFKKSLLDFDCEVQLVNQDFDAKEEAIRQVFKLSDYYLKDGMFYKSEKISQSFEPNVNYTYKQGDIYIVKIDLCGCALENSKIVSIERKVVYIDS